MQVKMVVWIKDRIIRQGGQEVTVKEYIQDDANTLYDLLFMVPTEASEYKGKRRTIHRLMEKLREIKYDADLVEEEGRTEVGIVEFTVDEIDLIMELFDKPPEKVQFRGDKIETVCKFSDVFDQYKKDHPSAWEKDTDTKPPEAEGHAP